MTAAKQTETASAVASLRRAHRIGQQMLAKYPLNRPLGAQAVEELAALYGLNGERVCGYRRFAAIYTEKELAKLCGLCEKHDRPLGFSLVLILLQIADKTLRRRYERQMIEGGWSVDDLQSHWYQNRRRPKVGRKPKLPESLGGLMVVLEGWCGRWRRLHAGLSAKAGTGPYVCLGDLTPMMRTRIEEVTEALEELEQAVSRQLKALRSDQEKGAMEKASPAPISPEARRRRTSQA